MTDKAAALYCAAWGYEKHGLSLMSDHEYDKLSLELSKTLPEVDANTGMWIHAAVTPALQYVVGRVAEIMEQDPDWEWRRWAYRMLNICQHGLGIREKLK